MSANAEGEAEAQLSAPASTLIERIGTITNQQILAEAESALTDRLGIPDFGVLVGGALCGYVELKAPGRGADTSRYKDRDTKQWERFKVKPNLIYTDGNEWCLYQNGERIGRPLRFTRDITRDGGKAVSEEDAEHFRSIFTKFLVWDPQVPEKPRDQARYLAQFCRGLRYDLVEALEDPDSPLNRVANNWRSLLFPDADNARFADSYAQTVTFALLLAKSEGADVSDLTKAVAGLEAGHTLLSRALQVLTDKRSRAEIEPSLLPSSVSSTSSRRAQCGRTRTAAKTRGCTSTSTSWPRTTPSSARTRVCTTRPSRSSSARSLSWTTCCGTVSARPGVSPTSMLLRSTRPSARAPTCSA